MKSAAIFVSLLATAAAFAPEQSAKATTALSAKVAGPYDKELGAQPPVRSWLVSFSG
jgi:hypothetical protein